MRAGHLVASVVVAGLAAAAVVSSTARPPPPTSMPATTVGAVVSSTSTPAPVAPPAPPVSGVVSADPESVVEEGLAAWGRFAVTGDPAALDPWFDADGPQMGLLSAEAAKLAAAPLGPPPYSVTMSGMVTELVGDEARVSGTVVFARSGETSQAFSWRVILRPAGPTWRIWTVEESSP